MKLLPRDSPDDDSSYCNKLLTFWKVVGDFRDLIYRLAIPRPPSHPPRLLFSPAKHMADDRARPLGFQGRRRLASWRGEKRQTHLCLICVLQVLEVKWSGQTVSRSDTQTDRQEVHSDNVCGQARSTVASTDHAMAFSVVWKWVGDGLVILGIFVCGGEGSVSKRKKV